MIVWDREPDQDGCCNEDGKSALRSAGDARRQRCTSRTSTAAASALTTTA